MIQSYKQKILLEDKYDSIIVGSGIGSLCTAALLSKEGKKVLVLERHYTAGGFTHVFKRKGYEWDVGIHYIGEVQNPNAPIRKMFDYITNDRLKNFTGIDAFIQVACPRISTDNEFDKPMLSTPQANALLKMLKNEKIDNYLEIPHWL